MRVRKIPLKGREEEILKISFKIWFQRYWHLWDYIVLLQLQEDWRQHATLMALELLPLYSDRKRLLSELYRGW